MTLNLESPLEVDGEADVEEPTPRKTRPAETLYARAAAISAKGSILYFDLETVPDLSRLDSFNLPPLPKPLPLAEITMTADEFINRTVVDVAASLATAKYSMVYLTDAKGLEAAGKNRKGVLSALQEAINTNGTAGLVEAVAERNKLLSVTPEFCRIAALGYAIDNGPMRALLWDDTDDGERGILVAWWERAFACKTICGFNVLGFDLPVILARSAILGVPATRTFDTKPWGTDVIDLMVRRYPRGSARGLKELARLYAIPIPAGDVDGSQVLGLMETNPAKVAEYVQSDVEITRELHRIWTGYFC